MAAALLERARPGERVLLLYPPGIEFIAGFLGSLYAGLVPVPAYPPAPNRPPDRLLRLVEDARPAVTLTEASLLPRLTELAARVGSGLPDLLASDALPDALAELWTPPELAGGDTAFLQYTSGSTATPKGVVVSHHNLLGNQEMIRQAFGQTEESVVLGWLPVYHDMGLIGNVLQPLYLGARCILMSPLAFLQRPARWLEAISRYGATTSGGPNFAYDLCVQKIGPERRTGLDLSRWTVAFNGAEPVRPETLERFAEAFAASGFRREAFFPCYGLAEATLLVSGSGKNSLPEIACFDAAALERGEVQPVAGSAADGRPLVGCGRAAAGVRLAIVDPELGLPLEPGRVGEIWVAGDGVAQGYWGQPEETARTFEAALPGAQGRWLRTGDLGFLEGEQLFVAGRLKDLIIIRGRNLYPQDVEMTVAESHPALRPGGVAAFAVDRGGEERLVVVCELGRGKWEESEKEAVVEAVRTAVPRTHEVALDDVVLLPAGKIPKTTSGKIRRRACREAYLAGELPALTLRARPEPAEIDRASGDAVAYPWLVAQAAALLRAAPGEIDLDRPLAALGFDSVSAAELAGRLGERTGTSWALSDLLGGSTLREVGEALPRAALAEGDTPGMPVPAAAGAIDEFPLSYGQKALWFLDRLDPTGGAYHIIAAARVLTPVDAAALEGAVRDLAGRHPALRTTFHQTAAGPVQRVAPAASAAIDFRAEELPPGSSIEEHLAAEAYRPFGLETGPPLRVWLVTAGGDTFLLLAVHHLVADFWSLAVLTEDLGLLYAARRQGTVERPAGELLYSDYVAWQEDWLAGGAGERLWEFWRQALAGTLPELRLPTDRPRPAIQTSRGGAVNKWLPAGQAAAVRRLGCERGTTLFATLLAGFVGLLARLGDQEDLIVGSPAAGRGLPGVDGLVGYLVNPVPIRCAVPARITFGDLLDGVRERALAALEHQHYPLTLLADRLQPARDASRPPLFQVLFVLQRPMGRGHPDLGAFALQESGFRLDLGGLEVESVGLAERRAQFDLTLIAAQVGERLGLSLEYNADLFDRPSAARLLAHLQALLEEGALAPDLAVADLPLLSAAERHQIEVDWNDTAGVLGEKAFLHRLFEAQADRSPEAVAVTFEDGHLTYRELDRRANQVARHLEALGARPESRVGIALERSLELVLALLGVLKAGAAFVPLDPEEPLERLASFVEDARAELVVSRQRLAFGPFAAGRVRAVLVDEDGPAIRGRSGERSAALLAPESLAYVLFTSGSTGRPKGVMSSHQGIANRLLWMVDAYPLAAGRDRVLQKTPIGFDVSLWELFWPLLSGARLVVSRPGGHRDAAYLVELVNREHITQAHFVPSMLRLFLESPDVESCVTLERVFCSGEALPPELAHRLLERTAAAVVTNLYGPTEASIEVTRFDCRRGSGAAAPVYIGRPIANTRIQVLDRRPDAVPIGVAGELHIGGVNLARGYAGRPDLTAERFVPNPAGGDPGGRLYRTGDLARFLPDGNVDYLGRIDHQVKIRGVRIEPGEIEAILAEHPGVQEGAVVVVATPAGEKRLVAYVVAHGEVPPAARELRVFLQARLPDAMVPALFVPLASLPRTASGKLDRRALPAPEVPARDEGHVEPQTPVEQALARVWAEILGVPRVGVHDNFFEIGGDSIIGLQVVSRARQAGLHLLPRQIFQHQTIAALAAVVETAGTPAAEQGPVVGEVPLTPIQREFLARDLPEPHHFNQAVVLALRRDLPAGLLAGALGALLEHHDILRARFSREGSEWRQTIAPFDGGVSLAEIDLSAVPGLPLAAAGALQASLDLAAGPLLRAALFRRDDGGDRLLLIAHHLVVDAVSWRILVDDLETLCRQLESEGEISLPPRSTSFQQWAQGLVERAGDGTFEKEVEAWLALASARPLSLPPAGLPPAEGGADPLVVALEPEATALLLRELPVVYRARVDELLLAALSMSAHRLLGAGELWLDLEGYGREELWEGLDLTRTVGWFTSRFPVPFDCTAAAPAAAVRAVKERLRRIPGRGVGYGVLRHLGDAAVAERLSAAASPEVSFNYLGQLDQAIAENAWFHFVREPAGRTVSPRGARSHRLEIDASIAGGRLEVAFGHGFDLGREETVEPLARGMVAALSELIAARLSPDASLPTPADFPLLPAGAVGEGELARLTSVVGRGTVGVAASVPRGWGVEDILPLSPTQAGLLFHALYEPASGAYFQQVAFTLAGELDTGAFTLAFRDVLDRHATLRAAFVWEGLDIPLQVVPHQAEIPWRMEDWRGVPADEQERRLDELYRRERSEGFDLSRAPLMRCNLVRLADCRHRLVWNHHHLLLDGWSIPLVLGKVFTAYQARRTGGSPELPPVRPFRDYLAWLGGQDRSRAEAYWRGQLAGLTAPNRLELEPGREEREGYGTVRASLAGETFARLRSWALSHQLTLYTVVLASWALLLRRYTGDKDVVFGATVSGRPAALPGVESMVGLFINTLPVRIAVSEGSALFAWLAEIQSRQAEGRELEHTSLSEVREWSPLARELPLFETLVVFENYPLDLSRRESAGLKVEDLQFFEQTHYPVTLTVVPHDGFDLTLTYDRRRFAAAAAGRLLRDFEGLLEGFAGEPHGKVGELSGCGASEWQQLVLEWNDTATVERPETCIHTLFEERAREAPEAPALAFGARRVSYGELDRWATRLAGRLERLGVGPDIRVGLCAERSLEMVVGMIAVLKAGGAYVPLDPQYPAERLALMLEDSGALVILAQERQLVSLPETRVLWLPLDGTAGDEPAAVEPEAAPPSAAPVSPDHLAYVIYTSGSTGRPKGVMVSHRNAVSFFAGMDERLGTDPGVWLAVTSISFDISVLELLWTLCRGFEVVLQRDTASLLSADGRAPGRIRRPLDWSLFYFAADDQEGVSRERYRLLLEGARFADRRGFAAVWTPERHFHAFGGAYPNPAVTGAAVAAISERIEVRAGSVVLPLHHPMRVAEEWSVVDNLSGGRAGVSFAAGWHANDFALAPGNYGRRKEILMEGIDTVRRLWRGEEVVLEDGNANPFAVRLHPPPIQPELPFWLTAAGNPETFRTAGEVGAHLLTHLLGQSLPELEEKIAVYRRARAEHGHDPATGRVTLMVHTFVGTDLDAVRETVREPFCRYLKTSIGLVRNLVATLGLDVDLESLSPEDMDALLTHAFNRYFESSGLFGTPESCVAMVERLEAIGVDEVACLIDFGVEDGQVLAALEQLAELKETFTRRGRQKGEGATLAEQVARHGVTHLQCTPSLAGMLVLDAPSAAALGSLSCLMVGGEALPAALAARLVAATPAAIHNMYGPTETTIWSSTSQVRDGAAISLGRPITNTGLHLLGRDLRPVPQGVAGELTIGGAGVVRGYLERPDLTAERFVPSPFGPPGARLYKTGDLARSLPGGEVEFLGRLDHQVKVRGVRIELGEIESLLARHPRVREAVVVARRGDGEDRLVAYLVPAGSPFGGNEIESLERHLRDSLPDVMIPAAYVTLDAFPLTPNGKVDRRALPDPSPAARRGAGAREAAPRTPVEEMVAEIWGGVLGVDRVSTQDSFFDLGGHSLLATQVVSRLRDAFQVELPLRSLFETPTVAGLAAAIERTGRESGREAPPITAGPHTGPQPLSFAQERLWFLSQLAPGSAYNDFVVFRLDGPLDRPALAASLAEIVRRHETLRTRFPAPSGSPEALVAAAAAPPLSAADLASLAGEARTAALLDLARQVARAPFDLGTGPVMRAALAYLGPEEHALAMAIHHVATDGWSWRVLLSELALLYAAYREGRPSPLPEPPLQYAHYARWQRGWLQGEVLESQLAYWREKLAGHPPVLELPADRPRPGVQSFRGATLPFLLPAALAADLRTLARRRRATLYMTLLALFKALLFRLTGQEDLLVGTPVANRGRSEVEGLIGVFVNVLVLRSDPSGAAPFADFLARVREVCLGAYAHQDLPFEKLVEELQPERDLAHTPLFQVTFVQQNDLLQGLTLPGLAVQPLEVDAGNAKFDLTLALSDTGEGCRGWLEYNTDLFDRTTMERFVGRFLALARSVAGAPEERLDALPLLLPEEVRSLDEWRGGGASFPAAANVVDLFARHAAALPDGIALVHEEEQLSYGELDRRSSQLAQYLALLGIGPEVPVGIFLERGSELVTAILAVGKAGGAYVPLDPAYPTERLRFMLADSAAPVVLTRESFRETLGEPEAELLCLDSRREAIGRCLPTCPASGVSAENPAYILFTSGSTGAPKGVVVSHGNVARLFLATREWFDFGPTDVWSLFHSTAFDFSVWEIWGALAHGGRLVVVPFLTSRSPEAFCDLLRRERVTVLNQTPSAFRQLVAAEGQATAVPDLALKWVVFGGEALDLPSLAPWFTRHGDARPVLVNMYGITETTVHVTYRPLGWPDLGRATGSAIGVPIPDLTIQVVDRKARPVPVGVPGELLVGGAGLARGYLGRPGLTAERFVPDAAGTVPGSRLYRSGDLVRFRATGDLEYLGRIDQQVKIRGFRIELGEIEAALAGHPEVAEAIVLVRDGRLLAYVRPEGEAVTGDLYAFLKTKLPEYMVPAAFVPVAAWPLTPSGKIDRRALPAPAAPRPAEEAPAAPRNRVEELLVEIWREVLGVEPGIDDNFFRLGGDSILSLQVVARGRAAGLPLNARQLFENQTIAELAAAVGELDVDALGEAAPVAAGPVPLTPIQRWFFERELAEPHHFNLTVLLDIRAGWNAEALRRSLALLPEHHEVLRYRFWRGEDGWRQEIAAATAPPGLLVVDLSALPHEARRRAMEATERQAQRSLDLAAGPLLKAVGFVLRAGEPGRLLLTCHHLVIDGVSWRILLTDLEGLYAQLLQGLAPVLPPAGTPFAVWARRLAGRAGELEAAERDPWLETGRRASGRLPLDGPGGANTVASAGMVEIELPADETDALLREVPEVYRTRVDEVLLAALAQAAAGWTGARTLRVDLEGHGREEASFPGVDLSRTLGWFTALYPVLLDLGAATEPGEALKRVKESVRRASERSLSFGLLRYLGAGEAAEPLRRLPAAEVLFNYWGQLDRVLGEGSLLLPSTEAPAEPVGPANARSHALEINCSVVAGRLKVSFGYSQNLHRSATVEGWAHTYAEALRSLVRHCRSTEAGGVTPSDFPLAAVSQRQLDRLVGKLKRAR